MDDCDAVSVTHHCHIVETGNESYRFLHSTAVAKKRIKAREQARRSGFHPRRAYLPRKKRIISADASGPRGLVNEPLVLPPDHA